MAKAKSTEYTHTPGYLTKKTAKVTLDAVVETAETAEGYIQGVYKAGYEANYQGLKVAKGLWDSTSEIRQDWLKLFAKKGNEAIDAAAKVELPSLGEVSQFGNDILSNAKKTVDGYMTPSKAKAAKASAK